MVMTNISERLVVQVKKSRRSDVSAGELRYRTRHRRLGRADLVGHGSGYFRLAVFGACSKLLLYVVKFQPLSVTISQ